MTPPNPRPFYALLGLEIVLAEEGTCLVRLPFRESLTNSRGEVHGGAIATLLDAALSGAARSTAPPGATTMTVAMPVHYIATGRGDLVGHGRVVRVGRSIVSAEARIEDASGTLVAQALGTLRVVPPR